MEVLISLYEEHAKLARKIISDLLADYDCSESIKRLDAIKKEIDSLN